MAEDPMNELQGILHRCFNTVKCRICLDLLQSPVRTRCGHIFCSACICQLTQRNPAPCPLCKSRVTRRGHITDPGYCSLTAAVSRLISSVKLDTDMDVSPSKYHPRESVECPDQFSAEHRDNSPVRKRVYGSSLMNAADGLEHMSVSQRVEFDGERCDSLAGAAGDGRSPPPATNNQPDLVSGTVRVQQWLPSAVRANFGITDTESPRLAALDRAIGQRLDQQALAAGGGVDDNKENQPDESAVAVEQGSEMVPLAFPDPYQFISSQKTPPKKKRTTRRGTGNSSSSVRVGAGSAVKAKARTRHCASKSTTTTTRATDNSKETEETGGDTRKPAAKSTATTTRATDNSKRTEETGRDTRKPAAKSTATTTRATDNSKGTDETGGDSRKPVAKSTATTTRATDNSKGTEETGGDTRKPVAKSTATTTRATDNSKGTEETGGDTRKLVAKSTATTTRATDNSKGTEDTGGDTRKPVANSTATTTRATDTSKGTEETGGDTRKPPGMFVDCSLQESPQRSKRPQVTTCLSRARTDSSRDNHNVSSIQEVHAICALFDEAVECAGAETSRKSGLTRADSVRLMSRQSRAARATATYTGHTVHNTSNLSETAQRSLLTGSKSAAGGVRATARKTADVTEKEATKAGKPSCGCKNATGAIASTGSSVQSLSAKACTGKKATIVKTSDGCGKISDTGISSEDCVRSASAKSSGCGEEAPDAGISDENRVRSSGAKTSNGGHTAVLGYEAAGCDDIEAVSGDQAVADHDVTPVAVPGSQSSVLSPTVGFPSDEAKNAAAKSARCRRLFQRVYGSGVVISDSDRSSHPLSSSHVSEQHMDAISVPTKEGSTVHSDSQHCSIANSRQLPLGVKADDTRSVETCGYTHAGDVRKAVLDVQSHVASGLSHTDISVDGADSVRATTAEFSANSTASVGCNTAAANPGDSIANGSGVSRHGSGVSRHGSGVSRHGSGVSRHGSGVHVDDAIRSIDTAVRATDVFAECCDSSCVNCECSRSAASLGTLSSAVQQLVEVQTQLVHEHKQLVDVQRQLLVVVREGFHRQSQQLNTLVDVVSRKCQQKVVMPEDTVIPGGAVLSRRSEPRDPACFLTPSRHKAAAHATRSTAPSPHSFPVTTHQPEIRSVSPLAKVNETRIRSPHLTTPANGRRQKRSQSINVDCDSPESTCHAIIGRVSVVSCLSPAGGAGDVSEKATPDSGVKRRRLRIQSAGTVTPPPSQPAATRVSVASPDGPITKTATEALSKSSPQAFAMAAVSPVGMLPAGSPGESVAMEFRSDLSAVDLAITCDRPRSLRSGVTRSQLSFSPVQRVKTRRHVTRIDSDEDEVMAETEPVTSRPALHDRMIAPGPETEGHSVCLQSGNSSPAADSESDIMLPSLEAPVLPRESVTSDPSMLVVVDRTTVEDTADAVGDCTAISDDEVDSVPDCATVNHNASAMNCADMSVVSNAFDVSAVSNAGDVSVMSNIDDVSAVCNTREVSAVSNAGDVSAVNNTCDMSAVSNTRDVSAVSNAGDVSALNNVGDMSAVNNTCDMSAVSNAGDVSAVSNAGDVSALNNVGDVSAMNNAGDISAVGNTGGVSTMSNADDVSAMSNSVVCRTPSGGMVGDVSSDGLEKMSILNQGVICGAVATESLEEPAPTSFRRADTQDLEIPDDFFSQSEMLAEPVNKAGEPGGTNAVGSTVVMGRSAAPDCPARSGDIECPVDISGKKGKSSSMRGGERVSVVQCVSDTESEEMFATTRPAHEKTRPPPVAIVTGLRRSENEAVQTLVAQYGGRVCRQWEGAVTHVVVKTGVDNLDAVRTLKYLQGVAAGVWVVSYRWVHDSTEAGAMLDESRYEAIDAVTGEPGARRSRLARSTLFSIFRFCCVEPFRDINCQQLHGLIVDSGGSVVDSLQALLEDSSGAVRLIVAQEDEHTCFAQWRRDYAAVCVSYEWLVDCVATCRPWSLLDGALCGVSSDELTALSVPQCWCMPESQDTQFYDTAVL